MIKSSKRKSIKKLRHYPLIISVVLFAVLGTALILLTQASAPNHSVEAEITSLSGNAVLSTDDTAASGSYVMFKGGSTVTDKLPSHVRIMTMGDSITHGAGYPYAYRLQLNQLLQTATNHTYEFVGSQNDGQFNHEGHPGWAIDPDLLDNYGWWLSSAPADLIIINGGVNGLGWGPYPGWQSITDVEQDVEQLVDGILQHSPSAFIIFQTVANSGGPAEQYIPFNAWIRDFVTERQAQNQKLFVADTATVTTGFADQVHPAQEAFDQFAQIIFDVIEPLL